MIEELQQLSQAIGTLKISDASQVVNAVNRRLEALLHPLMIKLYWRQEAEGGVILNPIAHIDNTGGVAPQRFQLQGSVGGMLSWVYQNEEPIWLENIQNLDLQQPAKNRLTGKDLPSDFLLFRPEVDSSVVIPLRIRGATYGVYSIESAQSNRLTLSVLDLFKRLGNSLALIIWNADTYEFNQDQTNRAINRFLDSIRDFAFDSAFFLGENYRSGFVARPFMEEFAEVQETVNNLLNSAKFSIGP